MEGLPSGWLTAIALPTADIGPDGGVSLVGKRLVGSDLTGISIIPSERAGIRHRACLPDESPLTTADATP